MKRMLLALLFLLPLTSYAHVETPICIDGQGRMVSIAPVPWEILATFNTAAAMATMMGPMGQRPFIMYDYQMFERLSPLMRDFIFAHECAHHAENHLIIGPQYPMITSRKEMELSADCFASRTISGLNKWTFAELEVELRKSFWEDDVEHGEQDERIAKVKSCWKGKDELMWHSR